MRRQALGIDQIPAIQLSTAMMDANGYAGIIGGNVLRQFSVQLDYAAPQMEGFCLGCSAAARSDVESPGAMIPFALKGGRAPVQLDTGGAVTIVPTRIPLNVTIEGNTYPFILDTGASVVSVRTSLYGALVSDGRPELAGGVGVALVEGTATAAVTRAKTITLGNETVIDAPIENIPGDNLLDTIGMELGYELDGLLGGTIRTANYIYRGTPALRFQTNSGASASH